MTLDEFRELTAPMPGTAQVEVQIRSNVDVDGGRSELCEYRAVTVENVLYSLGRVVVHLDEDRELGDIFYE